MRFTFVLAIGAIASTVLAAPAIESGVPKVAIEHQGLSKPSNKTESQKPTAGNRTQVIKDKNLRIMPLGASIMHGHGSSTGNGMRLDLLKLLEKKNNKVTYIGSQESGNMTNKHNEGHPGATIKEMPGFFKDTIKQRPNVVLVFVGTNDNYNPGSETAHERMGLVVDDLIKAAPDAAVLVAQITTVTSDEKAAKNIATFNKNLVPVIKKRADKGAHVALVNMGNLLKPEDLSKDGKHPNDKGHAKIAKAWYKGLSRAASKGWIKEPLTVSGSNNTIPATKEDTESNKKENGNGPSPK